MLICKLPPILIPFSLTKLKLLPPAMISKPLLMGFLLSIAIGLSPAQAQQETIESLEAQIASIEKQMAAVTKDRDALYDQLLETIDDLEGLEQQNAILNQQAEKSSLDNQQASASMEAETQRLVETSLTQIQSALAERDQALEQLGAAKQRASDDDTAQEREMQQLAETSFAQIQNALQQRDESNEKLDAAENTIAELQSQLETSTASTATESQAATDPTTPPPDWAKKLSASLKAQYRGLANVEVSELEGNRVSIRIGNTGLFGSGASFLSRNGRNLLSRIGDALVVQTDAKILVLGHTDNIPVGANSSYVDNTDLSNRRAVQAMQHLGKQVGIPFDRLASTGLADTLPIASNDTAEGRALNRRIELELAPLR